VKREEKRFNAEDTENTETTEKKTAAKNELKMRDVAQ
jgi:hypothetical protein